MPRKDRSPPARLDGAIEEGRIPEAWDAAREMAVVPLDRALRLTMLLAKDGHRHFESTARRFLERFLREEKPAVEQVAKAASALHELHRASPLLEMGAWNALFDLAEQIARRGKASSNENGPLVAITRGPSQSIEQLLNEGTKPVAQAPITEQLSRSPKLCAFGDGE